MKTYAAANIWLAFFNVTFQMKAHKQSSELPLTAFSHS